MFLRDALRQRLDYTQEKLGLLKGIYTDMVLFFLIP